MSIYQDVCIRNSKSPIVFDTAFSFPGKGVQQLPVYDDITLRNVRLSGGGKIQFNGFDATHRIGVTLDGVLTLDKPDLYSSQAIHTDVTLRSRPGQSASLPAMIPPATATQAKAVYPPVPPSSLLFHRAKAAGSSSLLRPPIHPATCGACV